MSSSARRKLRTCEIVLRERLNGLERDWLVGRLRAKRGVEDVAYVEQSVAAVSVVYDSSIVTMAELESIVDICGLMAAAPPVNFAAWVKR